MSHADHNATAVEPLFRAVSHYGSPADVLKDGGISNDEKRVILSSWASDMYAVDSRPALRKVPGIPHILRLDDILAALKQLDDGTDPPPPRGGVTMRLPPFSRLVCAAAADEPRSAINIEATTGHSRRTDAARTQTHSRWTREANVLRYRRLLNTQLTDIERSFIERRLAETMRG